MVNNLEKEERVNDGAQTVSAKNTAKTNSEIEI